MMDKRPAIRSLQVKNLLSFGEDNSPIELQNLNVLIGPNGSGKSNLIEVVGLLRATPKDLGEAIRLGGGALEWLWKGSDEIPKAVIEAIVSPEHGSMPLRYHIEFTRAGYRLEVTDEKIENENPQAGHEIPYFYFGYVGGRPMLNVKGARRELRREDINPQLSVLSQRKDPDEYPELTYLGRLFERIRLYRDWEFGGLARVRDVCPADLPNEFLEEDASNLGLVLDRLLALPGVNRELIEYLKLFYEDAVSLHATIKQGVVETSLEERYLKSTVPLRRLSDGTLRWLALLAVLLDPNPPPVICIEEPELGLHPHGACLDGRSALRGGGFTGLFDDDELQIENGAERFGQRLDDLRFQPVFHPVAGEIVLYRQQQLVTV